jgi:hypothetical protein
MPSDFPVGTEFWLDSRYAFHQGTDTHGHKALLCGSILIFWPVGNNDECTDGIVRIDVIAEECESPLTVFDLYSNDCIGEIVGDSWLEYAAMHRFMMSPAIVETSTVDAISSLPRAERRRHQRNGGGSSSVRIVKLRRRESAHEPGNGETHREYHHRWVVRAHWRRQWFPGEKSHHSIPIAAHLKGPEEAPLKVPRQTIFNVKQ